MTCSSIGDFVDYMVDFYQQRDRRKIVSTIDTYGDDKLNPTKLQGLRDREPAFDALGVKPKFSRTCTSLTCFYTTSLRIQGRTEDAEISSVVQKEANCRRLPRRLRIPRFH